MPCPVGHTGGRPGQRRPPRRSSWYEPFGMVALEGMVHGMAIAATRVGGLAEILEHEQTGLLFPPQDVPALTAGILRLVNDSHLRRRLGRAASEDVRHR